MHSSTSTLPVCETLDMAITKNGSEKRPKPAGRQQVVASLIAAGRELFHEHAVHDVTIRQIAERANVNPGLVHRHFANKQDLVATCFAAEAVDAVATMTMTATDEYGAAVAFFEEASRQPGFVRILASAMLQGTETEALLPSTGPLRHLRATMEAHRDDDDVIIDFVVSSAAVLGCTLFCSALMTSLGEETIGPADMQARLADRVGRIARGDLSP